MRPNSRLSAPTPQNLWPRILQGRRAATRMTIAHGPKGAMRSAIGQQILLDERVEVAVEHGLDIPHLQVCAMIFDQPIRMQNV
jgi:hypothetical protein